MKPSLKNEIQEKNLNAELITSLMMFPISYDEIIFSIKCSDLDKSQMNTYIYAIDKGLFLN